MEAVDTKQTFLRSASTYAGAQWLERQLQRSGRTVSNFGKTVADLLGDAFLGIYHIDREVTHERVQWDRDDRIEVTLRGQLLSATYDGATLTWLVILCHERCIRMEINALGFGYVRLCFNHRRGRTGEQWAKHPTIEEAVHRVRNYFPTKEVTE